MLRPKPWHLAAFLLLACGRIEGGGTDSTADGETGGIDSAGGSGSATGQVGTGGDHSATGGTGGDHSAGGDHATGGGTATDGAAVGSSSGGVASNLPEPWSPCNYEHVGLEPPCGESDVMGVLSSCGLWFDVPLAHIVPPASDLRVVLLPLAPGAGTSGTGGASGTPTEPLALEVILIVPYQPEWYTGETFDLVEPAGYVRAGDVYEAEFHGYVTKAEDYGVAQVALLQGAEILSIYRGLYTGTPDGVCVK